MNYSHFFSFDVESVGLFGPPFAVGWVVVNASGIEMEAGYVGVAVPRVDQVAEQWLSEHVLPHLPSPQFCNGYLEDFPFMAQRFWKAWTDAKGRYPRIVMVTDCPFPVEANFLVKVAKEANLTMEDSPYPVLDVASILFAMGSNATGTYTRRTNELPAHNPVNDARQSVRIMLRTLSNGADLADLENLDIPGLR